MRKEGEGLHDFHGSDGVFIDSNPRGVSTLKRKQLLNY